MSRNPLNTLFAPKVPEPSYPTLPQVDKDGQSNIPGIYVVGKLAGTPLVKLGLNAGHDLIHRIAPELAPDSGDNGELYDVVIIGSGSAGFAATLASADLDLRYTTIEADAFANTFVTMMKGKWLFAEPLDVKNRSGAWFEECSKEDLLENWRATVQREQLDIRVQEKVTNIKGEIGAFEVITDVGSYPTRRVVLAMGKSGNPRKLGIPGEKEYADRILHRLLNADDFHDEHITIVGAGDVACEAAIALAADPTNSVTLSAIDREFTYPKKRNVDAAHALQEEGKLRVVLDSQGRQVKEDAVEIAVSGGTTEELKCDTLFEMIGAELPLRFFDKVGIRLSNAWDLRKWALLIGMFAFVYSLYALKSYGKGIAAWPYENLISAPTYDDALLSLFDLFFTPFAWLFSPDALADLRLDRGYQQGFLYSLLYTVVMLVFGYEALVRWRSKAKDGRYQTWRYASLIAVQAVSVKYAWRAWGLHPLRHLHRRLPDGCARVRR